MQYYIYNIVYTHYNLFSHDRGKRGYSIFYKIQPDYKRDMR